MSPPECLNLVFKREPIGTVAFLSGQYFPNSESSEMIMAFRKSPDGSHKLYVGNTLNEKSMGNGESRIKLKAYLGTNFGGERPPTIRQWASKGSSAFLIVSETIVKLCALKRERDYEISTVTESQDDERVTIDAQLDTYREQCVWVL